MIGHNMRAALITLGSVVLTSAVIGNAYFQKKQFYPSVVYITKSNPSMAVRFISVYYLFCKTFVYLLINRLCIQSIDYLHSGLCFRSLNGKTYEKNIFWTVKDSRNGGLYHSLCDMIMCYNGICIDST